MEEFTIERAWCYNKTGEHIYRLRNKQRPAELITAAMRSYDDYKEEWINGGNECAQLDRVVLVDGAKAALWSDLETWETFITFL